MCLPFETKQNVYPRQQKFGTNKMEGMKKLLNKVRIPLLLTFLPFRLDNDFWNGSDT